MSDVTLYFGAFPTTAIEQLRHGIAKSDQILVLAVSFSK
jgi:hypothetical protein